MIDKVEFSKEKEQAHKRSLEEDDYVEETEDFEETKLVEEKNFNWVLIGLIFLGALLTRLYVLFYLTDPQDAGINWYPDVYHHWQIAYLTKEIGLSHGLTRLWDLKGMEYFWGIGHPYILVFLFFLTGTVNILVPRSLDVVLGSLSIILVYKIIRTYFNFQVATATAILAAFNPIGVFSDASGMQEPVGIFFILLSLYLVKRNRLLAGLALFIAGTIRAEFWVFGLGLVLAYVIIERKFEEKIILALGWFVPSLLYMKILLDQTGNPIYPVWWNFMGNAYGVWQAPIALNTTQIQIRFVFGVFLILSILGSLIVFIKKPKSFSFWLLGLGNIIFLSGYIGFTQYLKSYVPRFWVDRIMILPVIFTGFLIAYLFLGLLAERLSIWKKVYVGWLVIIGTLLVSQLLWQPIFYYYSSSKESWETEKTVAGSIGESYQGGKILIPEDRPPLTYMLAEYENIQGRNMVGQMYDPFAYMKGDPYQDWGENRQTVLNWLKSENIKLLIFYSNRDRYTKLVSREKDSFDFVKEIPADNLVVYRFK